MEVLKPGTLHGAIGEPQAASLQLTVGPQRCQGGTHNVPSVGPLGCLGNVCGAPYSPSPSQPVPSGASRKPGWHPGRHRWVPCKFSQRWPFGHSWGSQAHSSTSERQRSSMSTHPNLPQHPTPAQEGPPRPRAAANELLHSLSPSSTYPYPTQYKAQGETPMEQGAWGCSPTQNMPSGSNSKPSGQLGSFSSVRQVREIERNIKTLSPKQQDTPQTRAYMIILSNV